MKLSAFSPIVLLSFFFFLGATSAHASHTLSSHISLEVRPEHSAYCTVAVEDLAIASSTGTEDTVSDRCFEAVREGDLGALRCLLWDRPKSKEVVSAYCFQVRKKVHVPPDIKSLISSFVCMFEDANEIKDKTGVNLLHTACKFLSNHSVSIVELILSLNINVNAQSKNGKTALHYLCSHQCSLVWKKHIIAMFDLIVQKGGECKVKDYYWKETPLHILCKVSDTPLPLELLKRFKGEVINARNRSGGTPLHALCGDASLLELELEKSTCMRTFLIDDRRIAYYREWRRIRLGEGIEYLLTHGGLPSLRIQISNGCTPYDLVKRSGVRTPCVCCKIVCCHKKIPLSCFRTSQSDEDAAKELLLAVDPLAGSVCPKLSYWCWATRTEPKLIMIVVAYLSIAMTTILSFIFYH